MELRWEEGPWKWVDTGLRVRLEILLWGTGRRVPACCGHWGPGR